MESRERSPLQAPTRSAVPVPGAPTAFGRGLWQRFRASKAGCALILFLVVGASIVLFGLAGTVGPYAAGLQERGEPRSFLVIMAFGAVFFVIALRMLQIELTGAEHLLRRRRGSGYGATWPSDYPWLRDGMEPDYSAPGGGTFLGPIAALSAIALFNLALGVPSYVAKAVILFFDLVGLLMLIDLSSRVWQALLRVSPRVHWTTFPAFLGGRLEGVFATRRPLSATGPVRATLRCVRDEWTDAEWVDEETGRENRTRRLEPWVLYTQITEIPVQGWIRKVPFAFDLPSDLPGTDLMRKEAVYWQVVVQVPVTGPDFETIFLAPVYERPAGRE